jgi:asparagine synthase (glutamine-hydrolysing)
MCGIAGIFDSGGAAPVDAEAIRRMCRTLIHRGPDDEGIYVQKGIGLGVRRLSIVDLVSGHQPIHNEDESVWVVFNGEVYNFRELRAELEGLGHRFYTNSDTEVIVHLFEEHGADCVKKLRGMFAFAVYDERGRRLLLARDRLGIKPLCYAFHNGRVLFGSEISAIFAAAPELTELNREALLQYFYLRYIPHPNTAFARIWKLPPGHLLEIAPGQENVVPRQYWDLPEYGSCPPNSEAGCLEEMEHRMEEAVRLHLISDVPVGALLSGGTDSSTIVALMARASSQPIKTFSIRCSESDFDESRYAQLVAHKFGTDHHELTVEPGNANALETLSYSLEEPFGDSSMLPAYSISSLARGHVSVALSGDGGDELFAGYERCQINLRRRWFGSLPDSLGCLYRQRVHPRVPRGWYGRNFFYNLSLPPPDRYMDYVSVLPARDRERAVFSDEFLDWTADCWPPLRILKDCYQEASAKDSLSRSLYLETKTALPCDMLTKVDRMSMAASLEVRVPLLDHVFVEWVTRLPAGLKLAHGKGKYIFRKLAERIGVPREVLNRPKQGFSLPLVHWMRREMKEDMARILLEPRTLKRGYFNPKSLRALLEEHFRGRRDHSGRIWVLLMFELWQRNFLESSLSRKPAGMPAQVAAIAAVRKASAAIVDRRPAQGVRVS